jgi:hypothetical protein
MGIREQIMALPIPYSRAGLEIALRQAADLAEARENYLNSVIEDGGKRILALINASGKTRDELHDLRIDYRQLQERQAAMIVEIRSLRDYYPYVEEILAKYEAKNE